MSLAELPNLGATIVRRLEEVGVVDRATLEQIGAGATYQRLCAAAGRKLPVCYYLYSLEAALQGRDWRALSNAEKDRLRREARI